MKFITRVPHNQKEIPQSNLCWDVFWSADYSNIDNATKDEIYHEGVLMKPQSYGYTVILGMNLGVVRFLKRFFIKIR